MALIEKSRETVEQLLARRKLPKTYEEKSNTRSTWSTCTYIRKIPTESKSASSSIGKMLFGRPLPAPLATKDVRRFKKMYLRVFGSAERIAFHPIERFATARPRVRRHDLSYLGRWFRELHPCGPSGSA